MGGDIEGEAKERLGKESQEEAFAAERRISEIRGEELWVSVIGTVISRSPKESSFLLDDGTGQITVKVERIPELGNLVRVIARTFISEEGVVVLDTNIVQDFSCFDVDLYRKVKALEERVFSQDEGYHQ